MSRTVTIPSNSNDLCSAIELYHVLAPYVVEAVNAMIAHDPNQERVHIMKLRVRPLLDTAAYIAQESYGVGDNYFGGGGSGKPPLTATDTTTGCPGLPG